MSKRKVVIESYSTPPEYVTERFASLDFLFVVQPGRRILVMAGKGLPEEWARALTKSVVADVSRPGWSL